MKNNKEFNNCEDEINKKVDPDFSKKLHEHVSMIQKTFYLVNRFSEDKFFTLRLFLGAGSLSKNETFMILQKNEYKIEYKNVSDRIDEFYRLGLIERTGKNTKPISDNRNKPYKLTSLGLFWAIKNLEKYDIGYGIQGTDSINNPLKIYSKDFFLQYLLYDLVDVKLLSNITTPSFVWPFLLYLKQIFQEMFKVFPNPREFLRKKPILRPVIKWNPSLKDDKTKWTEFCKSLFQTIIYSHTDFDVDSILDPFISTKHLSFCLKRKAKPVDLIYYELEIDEEKNIVIIRINGEEYNRAGAKKIRNYFVLYHLPDIDEGNDFLLLVNFIEGIVRNEKFHLGIDILQSLYSYDPVVDYFEKTTPEGKKERQERADLAKDEKINNLITKIKTQLQDDYDEFEELRNSNKKLN